MNDSAGDNPNFLVKDGVSEFESALTKTSNNLYLNKINMVGRITGALGDPSMSVGDQFYFWGAPQHTGYYFTTEVEHKWSRDSIYTMTILGTRPMNKAPLADNLIEKEAIVVLGKKAVNDEIKSKGFTVTFNSGTNNFMTKDSQINYNGKGYTESDEDQKQDTGG